MKTIAAVSKLLRDTLAQKKVSQTDLGEASGVSRQTLFKVLKGTEDYKVSTLLALADKLGLELVLVPKLAAKGLEPHYPEQVVETFVSRAINGTASERPTTGGKLLPPPPPPRKPQTP